MKTFLTGLFLWPYHLKTKTIIICGVEGSKFWSEAYSKHGVLCSRWIFVQTCNKRKQSWDLFFPSWKQLLPVDICVAFRPLQAFPALWSFLYRVLTWGETTRQQGLRKTGWSGMNSTFCSRKFPLFSGNEKTQHNVHVCHSNTWKEMEAVSEASLSLQDVPSAAGLQKGTSLFHPAEWKHWAFSGGEGDYSWIASFNSDCWTVTEQWPFYKLWFERDGIKMACSKYKKVKVVGYYEKGGGSGTFHHQRCMPFCLHAQQMSGSCNGLCNLSQTELVEDPSTDSTLRWSAQMRIYWVVGWRSEDEVNTRRWR